MIQIDKTKHNELKDRLLKQINEREDLMVELTLNPNNHNGHIGIRGGKILKDGTISKKIHTTMFESGEYYFVQGFGGKDGLQVILRNRSKQRDYSYRGNDWGSYCYVDIEEISLPYEKQNDYELSSMYETKDDEVVVEIDCPKTISITLKELMKGDFNRRHSNKSETRFDDMEIELWKLSMDEFGKDFDIIQNVEEEVKSYILRKYRHFYYRQFRKGLLIRHNEEKDNMLGSDV